MPTQTQFFSSRSLHSSKGYIYQMQVNKIVASDNKEIKVKDVVESEGRLL